MKNALMTAWAIAWPVLLMLTLAGLSVVFSIGMMELILRN